MSRRCKLRSAPILLFALFVALLVSHAGATTNVTYPQEYYDLSNNADVIYNHCSSGGDSSGAGNWMWCTNYMFQELTSQREKAIQIAVEKNNELVSEQNDLLRNITRTKYNCEVISNIKMSYSCIPVNNT